MLTTKPQGSVERHSTRSRHDGGPRRVPGTTVMRADQPDVAVSTTAMCVDPLASTERLPPHVSSGSMGCVAPVLVALSDYGVTWATDVPQLAKNPFTVPGMSSAATQILPSVSGTAAE